MEGVLSRHDAGFPGFAETVAESQYDMGEHVAQRLRAVTRQLIGGTAFHADDEPGEGTAEGHQPAGIEIVGRHAFDQRAFGGEGGVAVGIARGQDRRVFLVRQVFGVPQYTVGPGVTFALGEYALLTTDADAEPHFTAARNRVSEQRLVFEGMRRAPGETVLMRGLQRDEHSLMQRCGHGLFTVGERAVPSREIEFQREVADQFDGT